MSVSLSFFRPFDVIPMFLCVPVSYDLPDAQWHEDRYSATDNAVEWSMELGGENVIVYEAIKNCEWGGYEFKKLYTVSNQVSYAMCQ